MSTKELTRSRTAQPASSQPQAPVARSSNPFDMIQSEIERVFDRFNGLSAWTWPAAFSERAFSPSMEVVETDGAIEVTTELPGMDEKDVEISIADGVLSIRGEKKFEKDEKRKNYRLVERSYGSFERAIALPNGAEVDKIKAKMSKGVLKVEIPKPATAKSQQIKVTAG